MNLDFDKLNGLIPAVVQDAATDKVLMVGFMNREALEKTRQTGMVTFYSRTLRQIWTKGETSRNYLRVKDIIADCDGDTLLVKALPDGPVCHTGNDTCFNEVNQQNLSFLNTLEGIIESRKNQLPNESYTAKLLNAGVKRIAKKVGEEAVELVLEAENPDDKRFLSEAADLLYHLQVLLAARNLSLTDVSSTLKVRHTSNANADEQEEAFKRGEKQWGK
ncbi:bifunctional phosphoribosyl-AMP cyclohydrolase/phosphoribosyl-ATP diphosphatase HisIE [Perlabentimonas gracilis]|uniref:bifunctional phosphoribosyl-AMP cyclohydrolase/phosphoribosyl-ATP diphosphatase HisIE n=1 Tax=Perlabentimonas gracilis TaxID=2715279 RepID=UPI00140CD565|nr:bifunctional phosphoribosyl-AMP cyclohydrolase/phosphoribosyl-ATP diphosphatase HisIE [Perlabentimonas gracilis]NHB69991.1 bifunctional phosphoribosyl-AMP cyclohydrolase/phosphoribosyl-ATP diphosphatase HisIE [Perlabentimonas gracilis]